MRILLKSIFQYFFFFLNVNAKRIIWFWGFINIFTFIEAQVFVPQFKHFTIDDGLSSSLVISTLQDYKGFMWCGTYEGLNRFDGTNFVSYKNNPADSSSICENHIRVIFEDHQKNLLIGTYQGLSLYNRDKDCFVNYNYEKSSALFHKGIIVSSIAEDFLDNLWLATNKGLIYFDRKHNKLINFQHEEANSESLSCNEIETVFIDKNRILWIASEKGIDIYNPPKNNFKHIKVYNKKTIDIPKMYRSIVQDRAGNIWVGSEDGLYRLEHYSNTCAPTIVEYKHNSADPTSISYNRIKVLFVDDAGNLWVGTENGGLNLYDNKKNIFLSFRNDEYNSNSLNNESIQAITQDQSHNLWFCTFGGGVNILNKSNDFIIQYHSYPGNPKSLSYNKVSCFLQDQHNQLWVGTDGGGVNLFDNKSGHFIRFNSKNSLLSNNAVLSMAAGDANQIWIGTWTGGLNNYDYVKKVFEIFTPQNSGILDNKIFAIAKDKKGDLWLGSFEHGLIHFETKKNKFTSYNPTNSQIANIMITVIRIDNHGLLYLGTTNTFQVFNPLTNKFKTYTAKIDDLNNLSNTSVYDILIENDTCVWLATQNGLNQFNPQTQKFRHYFKANGLADNSTKALAIDKFGVLWVTTNSGICRFDKRQHTFTNFNKSDGLQSNEFYERSILTTHEGDILAGGPNGFNKIASINLPENKTLPKVVITDFYIFNEKVKVGKLGSPLTKNISQTSKITLSYKQSVFTFYFAVLDFTNPLKNKYAYKMEGFDKDWVYSGARNTATYTNLSPGTYIFRVKGSNNEGYWNETGTMVEICIIPPWWKTKLAIASFLIFIILAFLVFYLNRINKMKKLQVHLENLVHERTREIAEKNTKLSHQTNVLNEKNTLLVEHQQQIENQNEMLLLQSQNLNETNTLLEERQMLIEEQAEELISTNENLITLNATKDRFFSIIAHDLKNPFQSILGFCELLSIRYDKMDDIKKQHMINLVYGSSKNLYVLLENLLQWAGAQTGTIKFSPEVILIKELIEMNISIVENLLAQKNLVIKYFSNQSIKIWADKNMMNTVIRNLITNAIKFTESGAIFIGVEQNDLNTTISIQDTGIGIEKEKLGNIFDIVSSKSTQGTRGESGTGLGLLICKEFIVRHGGTITVKSELGKGSTFVFCIPNKLLS